MFTNLTLRNFKSWQTADVKFAQITGVFGTNSSGKSSLIQFLLLLKQTKDATDRALALDINGPLVTAGSFANFIFQHETNRTLDWRLDWHQDEPLELFDPSKKRDRSRFAAGKDVGIESAVSSIRTRMHTKFLRYRLDGHSFTLQPKRSDPSEFELDAEGGFAFKRAPGRVWNLPGPIKSYIFPDQARTYYQNAEFLSLLVNSYETQLDNTHYLGPLREYPQREYAWTGSRPSDVGMRGERAIEAILAATQREEKRKLPGVRTHAPFQEAIAFWLRRMGLIHSFKVHEIADGSNLWQARVIVRDGGPEVLLTDVGFGVSQVLPVLTLLYYVEPSSTVILEQPEIHLHPLAQAGLADVFADVAKTRRVQVVVESHSEHLLMRLQRRVAEQELESSSIQLYFVDADGPSSRLVDLDLDIFGGIKNWPKNFMGDARGELEATAQARFARKRDAKT